MLLMKTKNPDVIVRQGKQDLLILNKKTGYGFCAF